MYYNFKMEAYSRVGKKCDIYFYTVTAAICDGLYLQMMDDTIEWFEVRSCGEGELCYCSQKK
jgi:hypothetical protein